MLSASQGVKMDAFARLSYIRMKWLGESMLAAYLRMTGYLFDFPNCLKIASTKQLEVDLGISIHRRASHG